MKPVRLLALSLALALLAGCIRDEPPAPVEQVDARPPTPIAPQAVETAPSKVTVRAGQSLYAVARDANVPVRALIDANHLQPPYKLQVGQMLTVPGTRQHIVQPGESLYAVARQYGVEASSLARENHLNPPYALKSGTVLLLPPAAEPGGAPPPAMVAAAPLPSSGTSGISVAPLPPPAKPAAPAPAATKPTPLQPTGTPPGPATPIQTAVVPPPSPSPAPTPPATPEPAAVAPPPSAPAAATAPAPASQPPAPTPPPAAPTKPAPPPEPDTGAKQAAPAAETAAAVAAAVANHADPVAPIFLWPVRGKLLSVFGTATAGTQNDGINIAAPAGTTVSAAESGTVAYAGNELRGFGNLLLIKHADGWVTAYAHNEVLLVKKGQKIRRGEPIARVGSSGGVAQAQLHFELRRGTKAIDPLDHLPTLAAGAG
jgi:murein DD-endopeptidase MepM/ murein hydrolase activator NlpD